MKKFFTLFYIYLIISCDKNIGILFDVSGSMEDEFQSFNKINSFKNKYGIYNKNNYRMFSEEELNKLYEECYKYILDKLKTL